MRDLTISIVAILIALLSFSCKEKVVPVSEPVSENIQQTWIGPEYWTNGLKDWQINKGRLECICTDEAKPMRTMHLLTHMVNEVEGDMQMSVLAGPLKTDNIAKDAATGFLIGYSPEINESDTVATQTESILQAGLFAGINADGKLFIRDYNNDNTLKIQESTLDLPNATKLTLVIAYNDEHYSLSLEAIDIATSNTIGNIQYENMEEQYLTGNVALVSNPGTGENTTGFWFKDWEISGDKVSIDNNQLIRPIKNTEHTLSNGTLTLTAHLLPIDERQPKKVFLETKVGEEWKEVASTEIVISENKATLTVENWKGKEDIQYRIKYDYIDSEQETKSLYFEGIIEKTQ